MTLLESVRVEREGEASVGQPGDPLWTATRPSEPTPPQRSVPLPRLLLRRGLLVVGLSGLLFTVWLVGLSHLAHARSQEGLERRFRSELANGVAPVNQPIPSGSPIALLEIPALGLREVVVEGTRSAQLASGPGHLRTSALPGQPGVSVLLARRTTFGAPFRRLSDLVVGDSVRVTTGQGVTDYRIVAVTTHPADDASAFVAEPDALLLVTSDPALVASRRVTARAVPVDGVQPGGTRVAQVALSADELGLAGSSRAAVGVLVWLELLVAAAAGGLVLFRRWRRWPAWVLAAPVVGACAWQLCAQLSLLLPATL